MIQYETRSRTTRSSSGSLRWKEPERCAASDDGSTSAWAICAARDRPSSTATFPGNIGWFHTLGSATLFLLVVQIATGIALSMSYVPSPDHAYESVLYIDQTPFGGLVRGIHHWAAGLLVLMIGLHTLRVFIWGAHRYPREITWLVGAGLFFVVLGFAFTGYLLPWDQKAYWATVVGTNIAGSAPLIGGARPRVPARRRPAGRRDPGPLLRHPRLGAAGDAVRSSWASTCSRSSGRGSRHRRGASHSSSPIAGLSRREAYEREYAAEKEAGKPFWEALLKDAIVAAILLAIVVVLAADPGQSARSQGEPERDQLRPAARSGTSSTCSRSSGTSPATWSRS